MNELNEDTAPLCPHCGRGMRYIKAYNRLYCDKCELYNPRGHQPRTLKETIKGEPVDPQPKYKEDDGKSLWKKFLEWLV